MHDLDETIRERRSVRGFVRDRLIPRHVICEALELAQRAPSNCNVQPWRVFVASGVGCDRLRDALRQAVTTGVAPAPDDPVDEFPGSYRRLQVDCAVALYKEMGVDRHDQAGRLRAFARNFEFFDAPHVAIVCMEQHFKLGVALDVGMYVQTLMLALWARGVASCAGEPADVSGDRAAGTANSRIAADSVRGVVWIRRRGSARQPHSSAPRADRDECHIHRSVKPIRRLGTASQTWAGRLSQSRQVATAR